MSLDNVLVSEGTECFLSTKGHYGFWYPDENKKGYFKIDHIPSQNSWISPSKNLKAIILKSNIIGGINLLTDTDSLVVWVKTQDIKQRVNNG